MAFKSLQASPVRVYVATALTLLTTFGTPAKAEDGLIAGNAITVTGDTLFIASADATVRLWGLETPAMSLPEGRHSKATMARLLRHCNPIKCEPAGTAPDGTVVARCIDFYGKDLTALMIKAGVGSERLEETRGANSRFPDVWPIYEEAKP
ncbi:MAG: hypothetical protein NXI16_11630 [Alphaproteobacteria bacterium]|nr:hypothetical protein [Alphaproteobacteria bacterium]